MRFFAALPGLLLLAGPTSGLTDSMDRVLGILELRRGDARTHEDVAAELAGLGDEAIPVLFALVTGEAFAVPPLGGEKSNFDPTDMWGAPDRWGNVACEALAYMPTGPVLAHLEARLGAGATQEVRLGGVRVLGGTESAQAIEPLLWIVGELPAVHLRGRRIRSTFEQAFVAVLRTDPGAVRAMGEACDELPEHHVALVADAMAVSGVAECVPLLAELVGRFPALDASLLTAIGTLAEEKPWRVPGSPARTVRESLSHDDPNVRRAAAVALARLGDADSFPAVVALLEDEHAGVRAAAERALEDMADSSAPDDAADWLELYDREVQGRNGSWGASIDLLDDPDPAAALRGVRELSRRRIHRDEAALDIARVLDRDEPSLVAAACAMLEELDARIVVPDLVNALMSVTDPGARAAIHAALVRLTGAALPADDVVAWRNWLSD